MELDRELEPPWDEVCCFIKVNTFSEQSKWGFAVTFNNRVLLTRSGCILGELTQKQAEALVLKLAGQELYSKNYSEINFFMGTPSAPFELKKRKPISSTVCDCKKELLTLAENTSVAVFHSKAAKSHFGFQDASTLAMNATTPVSSSTHLLDFDWAKNMVKNYFYNSWDKEWKAVNDPAPTCRQTRRFWPQIDLAASRSLSTLDRTALSHAIQILTGHGYTNYHQRIVGTVAEEECRFCLECDVEDSRHVITECPAFEAIRDRIFRSGEGVPRPFHFPEDISRLSAFISEAPIDSLFVPPGQ